MTSIDHANLSRLDLNLLVAFDALLTERSVTRAAARVGLGQSAMSHNLGRLRALFGDELLTRGAEGMRPTPRALALADPVRLRLLSMIAEAGSVCSCDLVEPLGKSQPTVSHHTKALADAGLITGEKQGRWVWWSLVPERLDAVRRALQRA